MSENMRDRMRDKYTSQNSSLEIKKDNSKNISDLEGFIKPPKKTYTCLKVEDDIMDDFRDYCRINKLVSHGIVMNKVLRDFIKDKI